MPTDSTYVRMRSGMGTKPVRATKPSAGKKLDTWVDRYLKKHPDKAGYGDSENYELGPFDDSIEDTWLYKKGMRFLPDDNNPSGED